jgi:alkaline phosphatase D
MMFGGGAAALAACGGTSSSSIAAIGRAWVSSGGIRRGSHSPRGGALHTSHAGSRAVDTVAVTLQVAENSEFNPILQQVPLTARRVAGRNYRTEPGDYIVRTVVTGLRPAQRYFYRFVSEGFTSPVGQFRTLPAPGDGRPIRFLHISCANEPPFPIGAALLAEVNRGDIDFIAFNGDTVYADRFWLGLDPIPTLEFYRSLYRDQRDPKYAGPEFAQLFSRTAPLFQLGRPRGDRQLQRPEGPRRSRRPAQRRHRANPRCGRP